jgi:hypothetical protein
LSLLNDIQPITTLTKLYCDNCALLKEIPNITTLTTLYCSNCPLLTVIPNIPNLTILYCSNCPWLKESQSYQEENITKLIRLQIWFKSYLLSNKLKIMIKEIIPLYYHPDAIGGYLHKMKMLTFLNEL